MSRCWVGQLRPWVAGGSAQNGGQASRCSERAQAPDDGGGGAWASPWERVRDRRAYVGELDVVVGEGGSDF